VFWLTRFFPMYWKTFRDGKHQLIFPPPARNWAPIPKTSCLHTLHRPSHATTPRLFKQKWINSLPLLNLRLSGPENKNRFDAFKKQMSDSITILPRPKQYVSCSLRYVICPEWTLCASARLIPVTNRRISFRLNTVIYVKLVRRACLIKYGCPSFGRYMVTFVTDITEVWNRYGSVTRLRVWRSNNSFNFR
jgi:hypothetical protein